MPDQSGIDPKKGLRPWQAALVGAVAGIIYGLLGFFVLRHYESTHMGETLFIVLPLAVGATIALITPRPVAAAAVLASTVALIVSLISLVSAHAEGVVCAALAFPLVLVSMLIGVGLGLLLRTLIRPGHSFTTNCLIVLAAPVLVFGSNHLEMKSFARVRTQSVTTTMHLQATPQEVWSSIQSLDKVEGRKPILMYLGLPVPQKCVLQGTAVGSKRTCYFDQGFIEETILEWDPPRRMRLLVDRTNMPGRHWLDFDDAEYELKGDGGGTVITRVTTIRSNLNPAWYWAPFESWGVESEHQYIFSDLASRFSAKVQP
jgi:hypothetical protein